VPAGGVGIVDVRPAVVDCVGSMLTVCVEDLLSGAGGDDCADMAAPCPLRTFSSCVCIVLALATLCAVRPVQMHVFNRVANFSACQADLPFH
jgi:hypothetical protein